MKIFACTPSHRNFFSLLKHSSGQRFVARQNRRPAIFGDPVVYCMVEHKFTLSLEFLVLEWLLSPETRKGNIYSTTKFVIANKSCQVRGRGGRRSGRRIQSELSLCVFGLWVWVRKRQKKQALERQPYIPLKSSFKASCVTVLSWIVGLCELPGQPWRTILVLSWYKSARGLEPLISQYGGPSTGLVRRYIVMSDDHLPNVFFPKSKYFCTKVNGRI